MTRLNRMCSFVADALHFQILTSSTITRSFITRSLKPAVFTVTRILLSDASETREGDVPWHDLHRTHARWVPSRPCAAANRRFLHASGTHSAKESPVVKFTPYRGVHRLDDWKERPMQNISHERPSEPRFPRSATIMQ